MQGRWDAACWQGCRTSFTMAGTRRSAGLIAAPCPMAARAASNVADPSSWMRASTARLFVSSEHTPMCVRLCSGESQCGLPIELIDPEHGRGCA